MICVVRNQADWVNPSSSRVYKLTFIFSCEEGCQEYVWGVGKEAVGQDFREPEGVVHRCSTIFVNVTVVWCGMREVSCHKRRCRTLRKAALAEKQKHWESSPTILASLYFEFEALRSVLLWKRSMASPADRRIGERVDPSFQQASPWVSCSSARMQDSLSTKLFRMCFWWYSAFCVIKWRKWMLPGRVDPLLDLH
jgi:hypothetical protein